jgi:DNA-binding beta-propeller fold protein YncE
VQARFDCPRGLALLSDDRVLVADQGNDRIRVLSADLQLVSTVAGDGQDGHQDGDAEQAWFDGPDDLALLPDGRVLVTDEYNDRIRMQSADLQQVSTPAGDGKYGHRDGDAAQAQFRYPRGLAVLPDGRVLVADELNHRIRMLNANLQLVSTVAGDGEEGHQDGAAAQARFRRPTCLELLLDDRVLVADYNGIRVLSADLKDVSTFTIDGVNYPTAFGRLSDGHVLVADTSSVRIFDPKDIGVNMLEVQDVTNMNTTSTKGSQGGHLSILPDAIIDGVVTPLLAGKAERERVEQQKEQKDAAKAAEAAGRTAAAAGKSQLKF